MKRPLLLSLLLLAGLGLLPAASGASEDPSRQFDFFLGTWKVRIDYLSSDGGWKTTEGTVNTVSLAGGNAQMDTVETDVFTSSGVRAYNVATGSWDYTMFDSQRLKGLQMWTGGFRDGRGVFDGEMKLPTGATVPARVVIENIEPTRFDWHFDVSQDGSSWRTVAKWALERTP